MKKKRTQVKIPSSTSKFIEKPINKRTGDEGRSDFAKLFSDRKLKQGLGAETYIKAANLLASGFSGKKYYGKRKRKRMRQAKLILQDFYELSTQHGKVKLFRPSKSNRKYYANELKISRKFKIYPLPVFSDKDKYKIIKTKKKRKLQLTGEFLDSELFEYPDMKKAAKYPLAETNKLLREINKKYGNVTHDMKIRCGEHLSHFTTSKNETSEEQNEIVTEEILLYFEKYYPDAKKWLRGIQVTTFKKQESYKMATERRGGKYLEKKKPKRKSKESRKHDKLKGR